MKLAQEVYEGREYFYDYQPMLEAFGGILVQVDDNDYQGDSRVLYRDGHRYGYLNFGWGSCSGCDALQGCDDIEDVQSLMDSLYQSIEWFSSAEEGLKWFTKTHDWEGSYGYNDEQKDFIEKCVKIFKHDIKSRNTFESESDLFVV